MTEKAAGNRPFSPLKDGGILIGWIGGLLLIGGLAWFFTQPVRTKIVMQAVNGILMNSGKSERLGAYLPRQDRASLGFWFTRTDSPGRAVVFSMMDHGILAAYAVMLSPEGELEALIPLSGHAEQALENMGRNFLGFYLRRIEKAGGSR